MTDAPDDPEFDGTPAAHPAWIRGSEDGATAVARAILERLKRPDPASGAFASSTVESAFQEILKVTREIPYDTSKVSFEDGVQTVVEPAIVEVVGERRVRIRQTTHLVTSVWYKTEFRECARCAVLPPLPDTDAGEYILRHNNGSSVVPATPHRAYSHPVRGLYPVKGWTETGDDGGLLCPKCSAGLAAMTRDFVEQGATPAAP